MLEFLPTLSLVLALCLFVYAAWTDFKRWKIENGTVLALIAVFPFYAFAALRVGDTWPLSMNVPWALAAGVVLFGSGFLLWQFRMLGAGDAKLMFPIGLFLGWQGIPPFALGLILFAIVALLFLKVPLPYGLGNTLAGGRLNEIRESGKVPYGVIMVAALLFAFYWLLQA